ncbi:MAG: hypothetical protein GX307_02460 [Euryarchaeota archaeon]|nr:hypothetical protein [Euryarchaeota archaeon]
MMSDIAAAVGNTLEDAGPAVATAFQFPVAVYFDVLRGLVEFSQANDLRVIYITAAVPARTILATFRALDIDVNGICFIDCISQMIMSEKADSDRVIYVESPTILENIVLKVEYLMRRMGPGRRLVVVDSINSLAIHNDAKILSEFLHVLISNLGPREAYPVVLTMKEALKPETLGMLALVCDQIVDL